MALSFNLRQVLVDTYQFSIEIGETELLLQWLNTLLQQEGVLADDVWIALEEIKLTYIEKSENFKLVQRCVIKFLIDNHIQRPFYYTTTPNEFDRSGNALIHRPDLTPVALDYLLSRSDTNVLLRNHQGQAPIHVWVHSPELLTRLLAHPLIDVEQKNSKQQTALQLAIIAGNFESVKTLLASSKIYAESVFDEDWFLPSICHPEKMPILVELLAYRQQTLLRQTSHMEHLKKLTYQQKLDVALCEACTIKNFTVPVRLLLDHGADVHACNENEESALALSCYYLYSEEIIDLLLERGATTDLLREDKFKETPISSIYKAIRDDELEYEHIMLSLIRQALKNKSNRSKVVTTIDQILVDLKNYLGEYHLVSCAPDPIDYLPNVVYIQCDNGRDLQFSMEKEKVISDALVLPKKARALLIKMFNEMAADGSKHVVLTHDHHYLTNVIYQFLIDNKYFIFFKHLVVLNDKLYAFKKEHALFLPEELSKKHRSSKKKSKTVSQTESLMGATPLDEESPPLSFDAHRADVDVSCRMSSSSDSTSVPYERAPVMPENTLKMQEHASDVMPPSHDSSRQDVSKHSSEVATSIKNIDALSIDGSNVDLGRSSSSELTPDHQEPRDDILKNLVEEGAYSSEIELHPPEASKERSLKKINKKIEKIKLLGALINKCTSLEEINSYKDELNVFQRDTHDMIQPVVSAVAELLEERSSFLSMHEETSIVSASRVAVNDSTRVEPTAVDGVEVRQATTAYEKHSTELLDPYYLPFISPACMQPGAIWPSALLLLKNILKPFEHLDCYLFGGANHKVNPRNLDIVIIGGARHISSVCDRLTKNEFSPVTIVSRYLKKGEYPVVIVVAYVLIGIRKIAVNFSFLPDQVTLQQHAKGLDFIQSAMYFDIRTREMYCPFAQELMPLMAHTLLETNDPEPMFRQDPSTLIHLLRILSAQTHLNPSRSIQVALKNIIEKDTREGTNIFSSMNPDKLYQQMRLLFTPGLAKRALITLQQRNLVIFLFKLFGGLKDLTYGEWSLTWNLMLDVAKKLDQASLMFSHSSIQDSVPCLSESNQYTTIITPLYPSLMYYAAYWIAINKMLQINPSSDVLTITALSSPRINLTREHQHYGFMLGHHHRLEDIHCHNMSIMGQVAKKFTIWHQNQPRQGMMINQELPFGVSP